ncbi:MAG TPA: error-prone DNA polymerase [Phycisphaerales bacterium]|nr:error-prone DNA polymerase [Phycisphaerales bacterium]
MVDFARSKGILCQGRGGAANSAVCYCLGITEVDPARFNLLFARFVSRERNEPPDIDIDFEHERREEVIQHIYQTYGREHAALTAEVISYRGRSAVRDVGKAMGLSLDCVDTLAKHLDYWGGAPSTERVREARLNPDDPTIRLVLGLTTELIGFPRHLSQHVGGFVITRSPLSDLVPIENAAMEDRTVIEWDKDDIDAMGMLKVDVLGLGMLTCIRKAFELVKGWRGECLSISRIMTEYAEDPAVYEMIQRADTVGVFQIESRAQMSMLPRLKPRCFYDLVIEVAIVRPGPIQGKMVHPYLRRREGTDPVTFPNPEIEDVLGRTLGVPLFQEQAMQLSIVAAGFSPDEADKLRRAMAAWKRKGDAIHAFGERLIAGMRARGYPQDFAQRCFEQIKGFSEYGFPESHAASFAILVYVSSWLKRYEPAAFAGALLNSQPMGFYAPAQIVRDAREHGVGVREIDVNSSAWDCSLEPAERDEETERRRDGGADVPLAACPPARTPPTNGIDGRAASGTTRDPRTPPALRLGLRLVKGLSEADANRIAAAVARDGPFDSIDALRCAGAVSVAGLRKLARADAFASLGLSRQAALWAVRTLRDESAPLFESGPAVPAGSQGAEREGAESLRALSPVAEVHHDYAFTSLSLKAHPISFIREALDARAVIPAADLRSERLYPNGSRVAVAGIVLVRQRPATASGIVFFTLEDETGITNIVTMPDIYERYRKVAAVSRTLLIRGVVERQGEVIHIRARALKSLDEETPGLSATSRDFH